MSDIAEVFQAAQEAAIRASAAVAAATGDPLRVYTTVPENAPLPYIVIGDDDFDDDSDDCQDGTEISARVHVWARPEPPAANGVRAIAGALRALLKAPLSLTGHDVVLAEFERLQLPPNDPDGSQHAILSFRYLTVPTGG